MFKLFKSPEEKLIDVERKIRRVHRELRRLSELIPASTSERKMLKYETSRLNFLKLLKMFEKEQVRLYRIIQKRQEE